MYKTSPNIDPVTIFKLYIYLTSNGEVEKNFEERVHEVYVKYKITNKY